MPLYALATMPRSFKKLRSTKRFRRKLLIDARDSLDPFRVTFLRAKSLMCVCVLRTIVATVVCNSARGNPAEAPFTRNDAEPYKGETVKKSFLRILLVLVGFAGLTIPARAQAPDRILVKVPFSFVAAGQTFPAGEYKVIRLRDEEPRVLVLIDNENRNLVALLPQSQEAAHGKAQFDFATVGDEHFLSRIQTAEHAYILSVPQTEPLLARAPSKGGAASSSASGSN